MGTDEIPTKMWQATKERKNSQGSNWALLTNLKNDTVVNRLEKVNVHPITKSGELAECANYSTMSLIPHASKIMLGIIHTD